MDPLLSIVTTQLNAVAEDPVRLLQLQNHLYGCFLVMEDIAERVLCLTADHQLTGEHVSFSLVNSFSQIGFRYGFLMDQRAQITDHDPALLAYRDAWIAWFHEVDRSHSLEEVDAMEDALNEVIHTVVPDEYGFFMNASETGSLSQEWISAFLKLVEPSPPSPPSPPSSSALAHAKTEIPIHRNGGGVRHLAHTRRRPVTPPTRPVKKELARTRRGRNE